jgi:hypothetical protein
MHEETKFMRKELGDVGAACVVIGLMLLVAGFIINYMPVPEKTLEKYVDNDHDGTFETPVYKTTYTYPYLIHGLVIFLSGLVLFLGGGALIVKCGDDSEPPGEKDHIGLDYRERMPPPYWQE